jgi:hypothetical protein
MYRVRICLSLHQLPVLGWDPSKGLNYFGIYPEASRIVNKIYRDSGPLPLQGPTAHPLAAFPI